MKHEYKGAVYPDEDIYEIAVQTKKRKRRFKNKMTARAVVEGKPMKYIGWVEDDEAPTQEDIVGCSSAELGEI